MKNNIPYILSGVLAIAVVALFVQVNSLKGKVAGEKPTTSSTSSEGSETNGLPTTSINFPIAYVNLDSVTANLEYFKYQEKKMEEELGERSQLLADREQLLTQERAMREENIANGTYFKTTADVERWQQDFQARVMKWQEDMQSFEKEVMVKQQEINTETNESLKGFLKEYQKKLGYSYVLPQTALNSTILYADSTLDITQDVIIALNKEYADKIK